MANFRLTLVFLVASLALAKSQLYNVIDTLEDLVSTSGWQLECSDDGYQVNVSSFRCNRHAINLPGEDLDGEVGFWTGCSGDCLLTYTLRTTDESFGFRAYLKNMQMIVRKNDHVSEYVSGEGWVDWDLDLAFTRSITLRLPHTTGANAFVVLDKVFIGVKAATTQPTTTISPSTAEPTTTESTPTPTAAPTPDPTTLPPTSEPTTLAPTPEPTSLPPTPVPTTLPPTPEPTTLPATPEPTTLPPTPEPTTLPPTPEPTTLPPTPEPTTQAPTPEPTTLAPTPEPTTLAPTPEPTTLAPTPEPTTLPPTPEPTTLVPTPEPTTGRPTTEPTTTVTTQQPTTIVTTQGSTTVVDIDTTTWSSPIIEVLKRHRK